MIALMPSLAGVSNWTRKNGLTFFINAKTMNMTRCWVLLFSPFLLYVCGNGLTSEFFSVFQDRVYTLTPNRKYDVLCAGMCALKCSSDKKCAMFNFR